MKKRIPFAVVLTVSLVLLVGVSSVAAQPNRKITGSYQWGAPGGEFRAWGQINVQEIGPGNNAKGWIQELEYKPFPPWEDDPWVWWEAEADCVHFFIDEETQKPAAAFVVQITDIRGTAFEGKLGEWFTVFVLDGGTPGSEGDKARAQWRIGTWPSEEHPGCDFDPDVQYPTFDGSSVSANIVIHGYP